MIKRRKIMFIAVLIILVIFAGLVVLRRSRQREILPPEPEEPALGTQDCASLALGTGDYSRSLKYQGLERSYTVHVPQSYQHNTAIPLVLNFHGGGSNGEQQATLSGMKQKADQAGFIAVHPNAAPWRRNISRWNGGPHANNENIDDVGFVSRMLNALEKEFCIDRKRIYATGISGGGFMSYRLACELGNRIAAIAPVAATLDFSCNPSRAVPVIHFHGKADPYVPYLGGESGILRYTFMPASEAIDFWVKNNSCNQAPEVVYDQSDAKSQAICDQYGQCSANAEVVLCSIEGGGHTWPGGINAGKEIPTPFGNIAPMGYVSSAISATDMMWDFFVKHPLP